MADVYQITADDERMGLSAGDVLLCIPYWLDPEKLTVITRIFDGYDPGCNVYRSQVKRIDDEQLTRLKYEYNNRANPITAPTGPNQGEAAERVTRAVLADLADLSIRARFYRGVTGDITGPVAEEVILTSGYLPGWYVNVQPGAGEVVVTAWGYPDSLGAKLIGKAVVVAYPTTDDGMTVDEPALLAALTDAVRARARVVAAGQEIAGFEDTN